MSANGTTVGRSFKTAVDALSMHVFDILSQLCLATSWSWDFTQTTFCKYWENWSISSGIMAENSRLMECTSVAPFSRHITCEHITNTETLCNWIFY